MSPLFSAVLEEDAGAVLPTTHHTLRDFGKSKPLSGCELRELDGVVARSRYSVDIVLAQRRTT